MAKEAQIVGFRIGREDFGIPIERVHEIVRPMAITAVPDTPDHIEGVINLRGKIVPVVDLRKRFGEKQPAGSRKNRIVVAEINSRQVGLLVDAASEVLKIAPDAIEDPPDALGDDSSSYVRGVAKFKGRLIILIDLERIMRAGELKRVSEIADLSATGT